MTIRRQSGFSLLETMVALAVLLAVGGIVMSGMVQLMNTQGAIANRTSMHTSVRSATELLQQEIGQAGKVSLGAPTANVTLQAAVVAGNNQAFTLSTSSGPTPTVYPGEVLTFDLGANQESLAIGGTSSSPTASFAKAHPAGAALASLGAFATGVVPPDSHAVNPNCTAAGYTGLTNGSTCSVLKLYGDINGDGNMVYVEYGCAQGTQASPGVLYRNQMPLTAASKPATDNTMILLSNVLANPNDANGNAVPCFNYQVQSLGTGYVVTNVAVTLTVQTARRDPQTGQLQTETKALLNVGPRNVVEAYDTASLTDPTRAQPMPASVANLLP